MKGHAVRGRRAAALAVTFALVAFAMAATAQDEVPDLPEDMEFKPVRDTLCWTCHGDIWSPPMKDPFIAILPPSTTGAPLNEEFEWDVRFQMTWNPKPSVPHLVFVSPILDLTNAPSLRFGGAPPDINDFRENRYFNPDPAKRPDQPQMNVSSIYVAAGVTNLTWTITPNDGSPTGPDFSLVYAPPGSSNFTIVEEAGPGQPESRNLGPADLEGLGAGNWSVGVQLTPVSTTGQAPIVTRVDYKVRMDAKFDTGSLKSLAYPRESYVPGGTPVLQKWTLEFVAEPGDNEFVTVHFDNMAWYEHKPPVTGGDFGAMRHSRDVPVGVANGGPAIIFEEQSVVVRPRPANGPTMTTISEAVGYASAFLFVASIVSGGMFGQASRRGLNSIFQSAKRRVAYHNFLSYGLSVAALVHMAIFLIPMIPGEGGLHRPSEQFQWTLGIIWGGLAMLAMFGLGITGAFQVPMIRRWSYPTWKWWHYGLTIAAILFTVVHMFLDGYNFTTNMPQIPESIGWKDPFYNPEASLPM